MFMCSLLEEEAAKRAELERIQQQQQRALSQTEAEKQELMAEQLAKERDLQAAVQQLERLQRERQGAVKQYEVSFQKTEAMYLKNYVYPYCLIKLL